MPGSEIGSTLRLPCGPTSNRDFCVGLFQVIPSFVTRLSRILTQQHHVITPGRCDLEPREYILKNDLSSGHPVVSLVGLELTLVRFPPKSECRELSTSKGKPQFLMLLSSGNLMLHGYS